MTQCSSRDRRARWTSLCCCLLLFSSVAAPAVAAALQGQPLADALRALSGPELQFVFSSQLLPDTLRVTSEPPGTGLEAARAMLAEQGLALELLQPGLYAVVRPATTAGVAAGAMPVEGSGAAIPDEPLREVVIAASRYRVGDSVASLSLLDATDLQNQPGIGDDPIRALQRLPGIAHDGVSARSNVRGGESSETLILLDGYPLRQVFHIASYQSPFSLIDSGLVSAADVYTGGFPARYGNRMSSVFDLHGLGPAPQPRRSFALDFFNASARVSGGGRDEDDPAGSAPIDWLAAGRIGTLKPLLSTFAPSAGSPTYSDAYLRVAGGDPSGLRVSGNLLFARDEFHIVDEDSREQGDLEGRSRYLWLRFDRDFGPTLQASLWVGQTRIESARTGTTSEPLIALGSVDDRRNSQLTDVRTRVDWQPHPRHLLQAGFELTDERGHYTYTSEALFPDEVATLFDRPAQFQRALDTAIDRRRGAAFLSYRGKIGDSVIAEIGGRAQRLLTDDQAADWISEPRLGLRWQVSADTRVQVNWGRFHQIDEINELQVEDGVNRFPAPQRSEQLILGIEHRLSDRVALRMEAFHKVQTSPRERFENLLDSQLVLPEIAPDRVSVQPTQARVDGVELSGTLDRRELRAWASAGWSRANDLVDGKWTPRSWDETWTLSGGVLWTHGRWQLGSQVDLHRGWPQTDLIEEADGSLLLGARNAGRLPLFLQIDLRAQYTQPVAVGELQYTAEIMNAQGRANECCTQLVNRDGQLAGRTLHWLPVVPSLGIRWSF
jgi:TonB dependent receptor/TonB-dependent Receptor Plug Domain